MGYAFLQTLMMCLVVPLGAGVPAEGHAVATDTLLTVTRAEVRAFLFDERDDEALPEDLFEQLEAWLDDPLDLNRASAHALVVLPWLRPAQAEAIVRTRTTDGAFPSVEAALDAAGVPPQDRAYLRAFLRVRPLTTGTPAPWRLTLMQQATRRLDLGRGYDTSRDGTTYLGSPVRVMTRLQVSQRGRWQGRLTLNKHAGEPFAWDPARQFFGYSHVAGHVAWQPRHRRTTVIVGDYQVALGQGALLWRGLAFGKGTAAVDGPARSGRGLAPYQGTDPNRHFRGLAGTVAVGPATLTAFASHTRRDAALDTLATPDGQASVVLTALPTSGRYRTPLERERRATATLQTAGGAIEIGSLGRHAGLAGYVARFGYPVAGSDALYRRASFSGQQAHGLSLYGYYTLAETTAGAELMRSHTGTRGGAAWLRTTIGRLAEVLWHGRFFPVGRSLFGNPIAEQASGAAGERGFYLGLQLHPHPAWTLAGYADVFAMTWPRFRADRPSTGLDVRVRLTHQPRSWLRVYAQGRSRQREQNGAALRHDTRPLQPISRHDIRLHTQYAHSSTLRLATQVDHVWTQTEASSGRGFLLSQDVRWQLLPTLRLDARLAFFDADTFDARVYAYEHDLRYSFSVPAFSGQGQRRYLMASWAPTAALDLQIKLAETYMPMESTMGSGLDEVDGNRLRDVRVQLRWRPLR
ncbi:MAG: hypothetical protein GVY15_02735 [Bacteroidetes bacterium]|jgi:hypothetical protein|nr:hypothetical protein [Bacteroidota bacterium]